MIHLVTGRAGESHITGDDLGHFNAGLIGAGSYVLKVGNQLRATISSSNSVTIADGDAVHHGRHIRLTSPETVTIQSGTIGQKRIDVIALRYERVRQGSSFIERASLRVIRGYSSSGEPSTPRVSDGDVLGGAMTSEMALYRVKIDGVSMSTPEPMFNVLMPASEIQNTLSRVELHPTLGRGVTSSAFRAYRFGDSVTVTISGDIKTTGTSWESVTIATGLPRPTGGEVFCALIVQSQSVPSMLQLEHNGSLIVRGYGQTNYNGGWSFGTLSYITYDPLPNTPSS